MECAGAACDVQVRSLRVLRCGGCSVLGRSVVLEVDESVAVGVGEREHRRHARPPQHLVVVDRHAGGRDPFVGLLGVRGLEPDGDGDLAASGMRTIATSDPGGATSTMRLPGIGSPS